MRGADARTRAVTFAVTLVGLGANPRYLERRERYLDLIAPGETAWRRQQMAAMSGSGLVVAAIWRHLGLHSATLGPPFKVGSAISRLVALARRHDAFVPFRRGIYPAPGDVVLVGDNAEGGVEHVYTLISTAMGLDFLLESVDGGQRDAGHFQVVSRSRRAWRDAHDIAIDASYPDAETIVAGHGANLPRPHLARRRIQGWVDLPQLLRW